MKRPGVVMRSVEAPGGGVCVDIFRRRDGSWGFEEYRRDPEDGSGWYLTGANADRIFADEAAATEAARETVDWFDGR